MKKQSIIIDEIPAVLWGEETGRLFLAVHGDQSHKEDTVIARFAAQAERAGYQTLSFDLPAHGARKGMFPPCKVQHCVDDLEKIMGYARGRWADISLFGCSIGAYFGMLAYAEEPVRRALFLSPVVNMERVIRNLMAWFGVDETRLRREGEIATPVQTLDWDYLQYVIQHPLRWTAPTAALYGENDTVSDPADIRRFAERIHAGVTEHKGGEHFFHTPEQMAYFEKWLSQML